MSFLVVTVPVSLLIAASLLALVVHAVRTGAFDDWDGPAERLILDDDSTPESELPLHETPPRSEPATPPRTTPSAQPPKAA